jgi:hypothetical protein
MEQKGCASCHAFSGVPSFTVSAAPRVGTDAARAAALAPDLRFTRERFRPARLLGFLLDPKSVKPDTRMPNFDLSRDQAADIAAYVREAPLALALAPSAPSVRLPPLARAEKARCADPCPYSTATRSCDPVPAHSFGPRLSEPACGSFR